MAGEAALPRRASPPLGERTAQGARRRPHPGGDGSARRRRQGSTRRPWKQICASAERGGARGDPGGGSGGARRPKERGIPAAAAIMEATGEGGFTGRRPKGRHAARIRDRGTRRSAVPRPRRPGEVAGALPPSLAQLRRAATARDLTEREDGGKGEREKGAERGEGEKGRREWRKKGVISLRGGGSTVSCEAHGQPHIQHRGL